MKKKEPPKFRYEVLLQHVIREKTHVYGRTNNLERAFELRKEAVDKMYADNKYNNYVVIIEDTQS